MQTKQNNKIPRFSEVSLQDIIPQNIKVVPRNGTVSSSGQKTDPLSNSTRKKFHLGQSLKEERKPTRRVSRLDFFLD